MTRDRGRRGVSAGVAVVVLPAFALAVPAQPLADRGPADAVVDIGWRRAAGLGPGYATSHLKGVIEASSLPQLVGEAMPRLLKSIGEGDDDVAVVTELLAATGGTVWRRPTAVYVGGVDTGNP